MRSRDAFLGFVAAAALGCGRGGQPPALPDTIAPRPARPYLKVCIRTDRFVDGLATVQRLTEAVSDPAGTSARITGQPVADPGPPPGTCWFTPSRTISFDDAGGSRWWIGFSVTLDATDATPAVAAATGTTTFTWRQANTFGAEESFSVTDGDGLLLASNQGRLLLGPEDASGLAVTAGHELEPEYGVTCGTLHEVSLVFTTSASVELRPGETASLPLGGSTVKVSNLDSGSPATSHCTDWFGWDASLAWRPPAG